MVIIIRQSMVERADGRNVVLSINNQDGTEGILTFLTLDDLVGLRDMAATFIAGQELPGAEIARQRKATGRPGGAQ
jgi:hypothetical protein